jgi:two-component sensor histidine kinase
MWIHPVKTRIKILKTIFSFHQKLCFTCLLIFQCFLAVAQSPVAQIDFKNSLPDLMGRYARSGQDTSRVRLAISISNFYLHNKSYTPAAVDSSLNYAVSALNLAQAMNYRKGVEDAKVLQGSLLIKDGRIADFKKMADVAEGTLYCSLQILLGRHYLEIIGEEKADLDLADSLFVNAQVYARKNKMPALSLISRVWRYTVMLERREDSTKCDHEFRMISALCKAYKNAGVDAMLWNISAAYIMDVNIPLAATYFEEAARLAKIANNRGFAADCLREIADINLRLGNLDLAEKQLENVLKTYSGLGYQNLQLPNELLSAVHTARGNLEIAMSYALKAMVAADASGTDLHSNYLQYKLGDLCQKLGQREESISWYQKAINSTIIAEHRFPYLVFRQQAVELIAEGKAKLVLKKLSAAMKKYPPPSKSIFITMLQGDCYAALHQPAVAERYYAQVIKAFETWDVDKSYYYWGYKNVAAFYIEQGNYAKAGQYLDKIFTSGKNLIPVTDLAEAHRLKFKVDSARGHYVEAIRHFETAKAITDSIFNQAKFKQSEQLQLQYKTSQREKENLTLRNKNTLQHSELEKEALKSKLTTTGLLGSVLLICLLVYLYRAKQKSNSNLTKQQNEINEQNQKLNQLLNEKEWLVKEIHHRVKNNLQIISSLLNSQSSYLHNPEAKTAIRDSQNRMHAISIVHHKLYQSDDLATLSLKPYIEELAYSICDSFEAEQKVKFVFDITAARLSSADTVPLGLILNEAITNSIKYAFTAGQQCLIHVSLCETDEGAYQLTIRDNGKGLPPDFDIFSCPSLGMKLMAGLTDQLSGNIAVQSENGTVITIKFPPAPSGMY